MLDAENPAEAADQTNGPAQDSGAGAPEAAATGGQEAGETAAPEGTDEAAAPAKKAAAKRTTKKATAKKAAAKKTTAKKTTAKRAAKKAAPAPEESGETLFGGAEAAGPAAEPAPEAAAGRPTPEAGEVAEGAATEAGTAQEPAPAKRTRKAAAKKTTAKRAPKKAAAPAEATGDAAEAVAAAEAPAEATIAGQVPDTGTETGTEAPAKAAPPSATALLFQPPDPTKAVTSRKRKPAKAKAAEDEAAESAQETGEKAAEKAPGEKPAKKGGKKTSKKTDEAEAKQKSAEAEGAAETAEGPEGEEEQGGERRRRRRGGRRRRRSGAGEETEGTEAGEPAESGAQKETGEERTEDEGEEGAGTSRRRRRRRRGGEGDGEENRTRKPRSAEDEITALSGSTRLEAKKQRRREGREAGRRRAPIVSEAEFLARRESVDRVMVIRQREDLSQIAVLEDKVLVEHYVSRESQTSLIGNVYLGRVQNVLPSMEAAFIDIGKGRNAVLYAGEVNWDALGAKNGTPRKIEAVLKSGQSILVQVTKDPIGHKGARLTSQISLPGRFLVYVPDGTTSGISRKLPDTERNRLKSLLKEIVPESAGVIVRTAAEGASEEELTRDVERLTARWEDIEKKVKAGNAPQLLYGEPDLTLKVVRDLFTEDFKKLVIAGDDAWETVDGYVSHVAPDLAERLEKYDGERDVFAEYRIDEQIEKALDRKVWLPSGGSLVIDRTEAMTVVDVNTGKFTGSGGNLEETVTKNNLEAAEEIVRQLRLRDIGGIIVIDFIDMVLESNRDLVLRRLVEVLGRDRTRHQVAEVTSLGLVQMTRKRIGTGLLEAFSESCEHCQGRGLVLHHEPVEPKKKGEDDSRRGRRGGRGRGRDQGNSQNGGGVPSPKDFAAMARHEDKVETGEKAEEGATEAGGAAEAVAEKPAESASSTEQQAAEPEAAAGSESAAGPESTTTKRRGGRRSSRKAVQEPSPEAAQESASEPAQVAGASAESASVPAETPAETPSEEAAEAAQADEAASEPAVSTEPKVTVRTRARGGRGRGRKAATSPGGQPEPAGDGQRLAESEAPSPVEPEASEAPIEPAPGAAAPESQEAPPAPAVVTTVRRRSARRAAGPPSDAAAAGVGSSDAPATQDGSGSDVEVAVGERVSDEPADTDAVAAVVDSAELDGSDEAAASSTPHVPVKKRGSRRR